MTPRLSIIAASIRRIGQAPTVESSDRYWDNVVLAMRMDVVGDSDPQFIDEKAHTVTVNGNAVIQTTTKKFGTGSAYFDGSGDYLTLSSSTDFDFGTGDFTVEAWIYPVTSSGMVLTRQDTNLAFQLRMALGNIEVVLRSTSGGTVTTVSGGAVALNTWTHIAITRSAGVVRVFSGGVSGTSHTFSTALDSASAVLAVGILAYDNTVPFNGYIDDLRITKGVARYTANFTPSTQPIPVTLPYDKWWNNVSLLMRMDTLTDEKGHPITVGGGASAQTMIKKTGTGAAYFDGVDDYLSVPSSADFGFGTGDFTIEAWVYILADSPQNPGNSLRFAYICSSYTNTNVLGTFGFYVVGDASKTGIGLSLSVYDGAYKSCTATVTVTKGVWHHVAVTRASGAVMLFLDGIKQTATDTVLTANLVTQTTNPIWIGATNNSGYPSKLNGYIDDLRITKGVARYISNFTPPGLPLPSGDTNNLDYDPYRANTVLLMHMDTNFTDVTGKVTTMSGCTISNAVYKFGGGSGYFNGSTSLSLPYSTDFDFGSGDFTIEAWIYLPNLTGNKTIIQRYQTGNRCWDFLLAGDLTHFKCSTNGTADSVSVNGPIITANTWTHVAVVRYGSVLRMFTNGVAGTDVSFTDSIYATNGGPSVGMNQDGVWYFNGYIDDLRITKGIARYVGNFTPPAVTFKDN